MPFETQSFLPPFTCPNQPSAAVFFESPTLDVPSSPPLPTATSYCLDLARAKKNDPHTPLATIEGISIPCPPINHGPTNSIAYECSDIPSEPFSLLEANPTPTGTQDHFPEAWHPMPMTHSLSADVDCGFQWIAQQAAQDHIPSDKQKSQVSSHPTTNNNDPDTYFQHIVLNQDTCLFYGEPQSCGHSVTKERRRQRNSIAARKYRQKRLDRIAELEQALAKTEKERDNLMVQLECWKTKAKLLQELTAGSRGSGCKRGPS
ncbi:MAG: hypothetical protein M1830_006276 [Pleopsidium flavum]|nr:MAG: hypothetical protein M1830_006276 [Pleopsidium flavum]